MIKSIRSTSIRISDSSNPIQSNISTIAIDNDGLLL